MEPSVKVLYSESNHIKLQPGSVMSLGAANSLFEQRDFECSEQKTAENLVYEISYYVNNELRTYCCSQNLGDGEGSVINHLRKSTIEQLEILDASCPPVVSSAGVSKTPFSILRVSCNNMLQLVLPQLEAYCLAYKTVDIIESYDVKNAHSSLQNGLSATLSLIQREPDVFLTMLDDVISKNPENVSLISAVETVIDKTERYVSLLEKKDGSSKDLVEILKQATRRATLINENSVLNYAPPPVDKVPYFELDLFD